MAKRKCSEKQVIENACKNSVRSAKTPKNQVFFTGRPDRSDCVICGVEFDRPPQSRLSTCSETCDRERRIRYGAAYRQELRDLKARLKARFGGRMPTADEVLALYWRSRGYDAPPEGLE